MQGTKGNEMAADYIQKRFKEFGLEEINNKYTSEFHGDVIGEREASINIYFQDGTIKRCVYGKDFAENMFKPVSMRSNVIFSMDESSADNSIVVLKDKSQLLNSSDRLNKKDIFLIKTDVFRGNSSINKGQIPFIVQISDEIYNLLNKNPDAIADMNFKGGQNGALLNNIVGKISGENSSRAIVLSAHFDSMGNMGDNIFRGALDNGSGVSVLLDIAYKLSMHAKQSKFNEDIIICTFNSEEDNLNGSKQFCEKVIKDQYKYEDVVNINIDCIGLKGIDSLIIDGDLQEDKHLIEEINKYFTSKGYKCEIGNDIFGSDHLSFLNNNMSAICFGQFKEGIFHTFNDTSNNLDIDYMSNFSENVCEFIVDYDEKLFDLINRKKSNNDNSMQITEEEREIEEFIQVERKKLGFNQYKFTKVGDNIVLLNNNDCDINNIDDFKDIYPGKNLTESLLDYKLEYIYM